MSLDVCFPQYFRVVVRFREWELSPWALLLQKCTAEDRYRVGVQDSIFLLFFWQYQPELSLGEISGHKYLYISLKIPFLISAWGICSQVLWLPAPWVWAETCLFWEWHIVPVPGKPLEDVISLPTAAILTGTSWHSRLKQMGCICMPKGMPKNFALSLASRSNKGELSLVCPPLAYLVQTKVSSHP